MALIKFSSIAVTDMSGKAGGSVFSKNKGGAYTKNFVVPNNPQTAAQVDVRSLFGTNSAQWRQLTQEQRDEWNAAAQNFPYSNRMGDQKVLSGQGLYVKLNQNLRLIGDDRIASPPLPQSPDLISSFTAVGTRTTGASDFALDITAVFEDVTMTATSVLVFASPVVSAGITNVNNKFRLLGFTTKVAITTGVDFGTQYATVFGQPAIGGKIGVRLVTIAQNIGTRGPDTQLNLFVTANP